MQLELKKIKISKGLSHETIAFTGELWVNGEKAALVENSGTGGPNRVYPFPSSDENKFKLVKEADEYCKTLPPVPSGEDDDNLPMDLEFWISLEVGKIEQLKAVEKHSKKGIVIGNPNNLIQYRILKLPGKIEEILRQPNGMGYLEKAIVMAREKLKPGEEILNKNIPEGLLK